MPRFARRSGVIFFDRCKAIDRFSRGREEA
jgi:hypothetical protein